MQRSEKNVLKKCLETMSTHGRLFHDFCLPSTDVGCLVSVFKPAVDLICDPNYFNEKVLGWLEYREKLAQEHKRTYTYAATYEDFMTKITECDDIEHLRQMRYFHSSTLHRQNVV